MITSDASRLVAAVRDRESDVRQARQSLDVARMYRLTGERRSLVARALRVVSLANNTVRISNHRIAVEASNLALCACNKPGHYCTCVAPF